MFWSRLRLRFWAVCQLFYELFTRPTWADRRGSFKEQLSQTLLPGHLNSLLFMGVEDHFPDIRKRSVFLADELIGVAIEAIRRNRDLGRRRSGYLDGYLHAALDHLRRCGRCQRAAVAAMFEDVEQSKHIRKILSGSQPPPPNDFV